MAKYTHKKRQAIAETKQGRTLSRAQQDELKWLGDAFRSLGRRTTAQAYEIGDYLSRAKSILPEKELGAWIKEVCKFTPKTGRNYTAVHTNLMDYKERLEAAAVAPTILFVLAYAERQYVEAVIAAIEAGEQLTVAQVKAMVGVAAKKRVASSDEALNVGGIAGLRKAAELKTSQDMAQFHGLMAAVLKRVEVAMEPLAKGRAVKKGQLQDAIIYDCRHAHDLLNSIAAPMKAEMVQSMNWRPARLPEGSAWRKVQVLLHRMGGADDWPDRTGFVDWLRDEVVPLMRFVVHGEPLVSAEEDLATAEGDAVESDDRAQKEREVALARISSVLNGATTTSSRPRDPRESRRPESVAAA